MDFDPGFSSKEESLFDFNTTTSAVTKKKSFATRMKRSFSNNYRRQYSTYSDDTSGSIGCSTDTRHSPASDTNSLSSPSSCNTSRASSRTGENKKKCVLRRRRLRRQEDEEHRNGQELPSTRSCSSRSTETVADSISNTVMISRVSVRRGAGSYAVQDAGTYQMLHDECCTINIAR